MGFESVFTTSDPTLITRLDMMDSAAIRELDQELIVNGLRKPICRPGNRPIPWRS